MAARNEHSPELDAQTSWVAAPSLVVLTVTAGGRLAPKMPPIPGISTAAPSFPVAGSNPTIAPSTLLPLPIQPPRTHPSSPSLQATVASAAVPGTGCSFPAVAVTCSDPLVSVVEIEMGKYPPTLPSPPAEASQRLTDGQEIPRMSAPSKRRPETGALMVPTNLSP